MKKVLLTTLLIFIALAGAVVPAFAESNDMVKSNYEKDKRYINNYSNDSINNLLSKPRYNINSRKILPNVTNLGNTNFNYLYSAYTVTLNPDINNTHIDSGTFEVYEHPGLSTSTITGVVDESFPVFIAFNTNYYVSDSAMYNNTYAKEIAFISLDDPESAFTNFGLKNSAKNVWNLATLLLNKTIDATSSNVSISSVSFATLYSLGYRRLDTKYSNELGGYAYMVAKFKNLDYSDFEGSLSLSGTQASSYFYKFDFIDPRFNNSYYNNQQVSYYKLTLQHSNFNTTADFTTLMVYDKSNVFIESRTADTINLVIFPNNNDYSITFFRYLSFYVDDNNSTLGNISVTAYYDDSYSISNGNDYTNQLTSINSNLVLIKNLISDLQVQEINNIYQNISNNYDIDIETNINGLIDDLELNLNGLNIDNPKFSLTNSDSEAENKLSVFKQIGTAIINVYDDNGLSYLYFVPIVLLIIGAVIV